MKKEKEIEELEEVVVEKKKSHKLLNFLILLVILIVLIIFYSKYIGTKGIIVKEYRVESNILTDNFSGIKIVHFSDLLYKSTTDKEDVKELVKKINILRPDIVVFTGNLVNKNAKITTDDNDFLVNELSKIHANIGKYAIYGDYDYNYKSFVSVIDKSGFKLLNNEYEEIYYKNNSNMYIVGLPSSIKENINLDEAFKFYNELERKYTIVLVHEGKTIKYLDDSTYEVDMILGGHSLNGSVVIPFYGGLFNDSNSYKYKEPTYTKGITKIFISSGLGTRDYSYRFLNRPSFNLYRLKAHS